MERATTRLDRNIQELARLWTDALPALPSWRQAVARARDLTNELRTLLEFFDSKRVTTIAASLPGERTSLALPDERNEWIGAVAAELAKRAVQGARAELEEVLEAIRECGNRAAHPCLAAMAEAVKTRDFNGYCTARDERERIREQKERLARYDALLEKLDRSCPGLTKLLRSTAGDSDWTERIRAMNQAAAAAAPRALHSSNHRLGGPRHARPDAPSCDSSEPSNQTPRPAPPPSDPLGPTRPSAAGTPARTVRGSLPW